MLTSSPLMLNLLRRFPRNIAPFAFGAQHLTAPPPSSNAIPPPSRRHTMIIIIIKHRTNKLGLGRLSNIGSINCATPSRRRFIRKPLIFRSANTIRGRRHDPSKSATSNQTKPYRQSPYSETAMPLLKMFDLQRSTAFAFADSNRSVWSK